MLSYQIFQIYTRKLLKTDNEELSRFLHASHFHCQETPGYLKSLFVSRTLNIRSSKVNNLSLDDYLLKFGDETVHS